MTRVTISDVAREAGVFQWQQLAVSLMAQRMLRTLEKKS